MANHSAILATRRSIGNCLNAKCPGMLAVRPPTLPGAFVLVPSLCGGTAANRRVVEADVTAAAALAARAETIAAGLDHCTAGFVARGAADAAAVFGVFALANTDGEVALAARNSIAGATAAAETIGQHAAEVLQRATGDFVLAAAMDLAAVRGLFELNGATRQHAPVRRLWLADLTWLNAGDRAGKWCDRGRSTFQ
jgi:hypothetical protein